MAKMGSNGTLKLIGSLILIGGFAITVGTLLVRGSWQASVLSKDLEQNCNEDRQVHPIALQSEKVIIKIESNVAQTQKDVSQIIKSQETIEKKLDDLFMMQMVGPGSSGPTR